MKSSPYLKHKWSTERGWPCIFARAVCATRPWGGLFGLAQSCQGGSHPSKRYEWRPLWPVMIFSLLFNRRPAFQHWIIRRAHLKSMGGSLEEPRNNFLPKQFEKAKSGRRRPLLSVTQAESWAIWDCGTWSTTLRHVTPMRHDRPSCLRTISATLQ